VEEELEKETLKWLERIEERVKVIDGDKSFIENINAYVSDSRYFLKKKDLVRAFECVVWAWAWLEIGIEVGKLK
jgi:hypothetical protein